MDTDVLYSGDNLDIRSRALHRFFRRAAFASLLPILIGCQAMENQPTPPPALIVHLDADGGCGLEGSIFFTAGTMPVQAVNDTGDPFSVKLLEPDAGYSFDDIVAAFEPIQDALAYGGPVPTPPPWITEVARLEVEPGQEGDLDPPLGLGSYTVLCWAFHPPDELFAVQVLGPLDVTESP